MSLDPDKEEERQEQVKEAMQNYDDTFGELDMEKSYAPLFELLWYSQLPCMDVKGLTSRVKDELAFIKKCSWLGRC